MRYTHMWPHTREIKQATLEEVMSADVLLHVVDGSSPHALTQRCAVVKVLQQLGLSEYDLNSRTIEVWNKMDAVQGAVQGAVQDAVQGAVQGNTWSTCDSLRHDGQWHDGQRHDGQQSAVDLSTFTPHAAAAAHDDNADSVLPASAVVARVAVSVKTKYNIDQLLTMIDDKVRMCVVHGMRVCSAVLMLY